MQDLKTGRKKIHGDFCVFNILTDKKNNVSIIDDRENTSKSILVDHFYFYISFLRRIKRHNNLFNIKQQNLMKKKLDNIFLQVFKNENYKILEEVEKITLEDLPSLALKNFFDKTKIKFRKLLESAIN